MFRALTRRWTTRSRASTPSSPIVRHRASNASAEARTAQNAARHAAPVWTGDDVGDDGAARARNVFARFGSPEAVTFAHRGIASGVEAEVSGRERRDGWGDRRTRAKRGFEARAGGGETEVDARVTIRVRWENDAE